MIRVKHRRSVNEPSEWRFGVGTRYPVGDYAYSYGGREVISESCYTEKKLRELWGDNFMVIGDPDLLMDEGL